MSSLTAQDAFLHMINDLISPALREAGFTGTRGSYAIPSDTHWIQLGFQRSRYSNATMVEFTVNCKVVRRDAWDAERQKRPFIGAKPSASTGAGKFEWWRRLGQLMPQPSDKWWTLRPEDDAARLADEVVKAIRSHALPAMQAQVAATS